MVTGDLSLLDYFIGTGEILRPKNMKTQTNSLPVPAVFNAEPSQIAALITVDGPAFARWRKAAAKATAAKKEADTLRLVCGFPETMALVDLLGVRPEGESKTGVVVDGNGIAIGKLSVWWRDEFTTPAGFVSRVS